MARKIQKAPARKSKTKAKLRLEDDPRFLGRIESARASLRAGRGVRLEDVKDE